ncbi:MULTISPECIES: 3-oxoacyl-[acyl-carrier-protein] synthase III C-terminal domain-containing protein [Kamptonema]|uniref:3-oxoacyl-[acyl-carrier-protein] synthase III C-terminal domain-containing protein n=1 Tax=Kamptonema TaxID=1501433 RepID=UPI0001DACCF1|nr:MULTISPECIES: 3-oxoacyl-[acyl-carrier-protein] synthase III C-terminal domain-containing protein [Kamptonema]CBN59226.1 putative 3-Oxoacyl-(Acyl-carrier-protein (ACP)) synthase III [Kamptonema sp. PCC 6506]
MVMINPSVGIRSLALSFPSLIRTNDYWLEKFPHLFAVTSSRRTRLFQSNEFTSNDDELAIWSQEVAPYLSDPFRGNVERRVLGAGESSLMLECRAAKDALDAAKLSTDEVELAIVASIFPEQLVPGNASYLAGELQLQCPAWNLESTCSSALIALQNARALVQMGEYRNVLVVVSHIESNSIDDEDTLSWSMGDGAGAFVVDSLNSNQGVLGSKIINTAATCGAYLHELTIDAQGKPGMRTRTGENASSFAETSVEFVRTCCEGAVAAAGVSLEQIDFFAFNTPTAWYARLCARALGIDLERTIDLYPWYANIGSVFAIANLYHAALAGKIRENDLVLVYTNGAAATAAATVMRWGDVALGKPPAPPINANREEEEKSTVNLFGVNKAVLSKEKLFAAAPREQQQILESYLIEWLTNSLQLPFDRLSPQHSLALLLDSLMAFELRSRIEADLQVRVPIERFFGDNNITQLAELVLNQLALASLTASESVFITEFKAEEEREILSI